MPELPGVLGIIAQEVGTDKALRVGVRLAGGEYKFPAASTLKRLSRDQQIKKSYASGESITNLSEKWGVSPRQIYRIIFSENFKK